MVGGGLVPENSGQVSAAPGDAGPNGSRRDLQGAGDLGVIEAGDVPQHDRDPELLGQLIEGAGEGQMVGQPFVVARFVGHGLRDLLDRDGPTLAAAELIEAGVGGHPVAPGPECRATVEAGKTSNDGQERLLTAVSGVGVVPGDPPTHRVETVVVEPEQLVHGLGIAPLGPGHQFGIGRVDAGQPNPSAAVVAAISTTTVRYPRPMPSPRSAARSSPAVVAVTGAAGFIGSRLTMSLAGDGISVVGIDAFNDHLYEPALKRAAAARLAERSGTPVLELDIGQAGALADVLERAGVEAVVHLAALAGVRSSMERPGDYHRANVDGTASVLEAMGRAGVDRLVFASSSSVYGANPDVPWIEEAEPDPQSPYAETKRLGEQLVRRWASGARRQAVITRLFTVYGPGQRPDQAITRFAVRMLRGEPIEIYGDGSARRDLTHVDDVVAGLRAALGDRPEPLTTCNLARGRRVSLVELVAVMEQVLGVRADVRFIDPVAGDAPQTWGSIEKAAAELHWEPTVDLVDGIASARPWFERLAGGLADPGLPQCRGDN